jgi:hypothetical protein
MIEQLLNALGPHDKKYVPFIAMLLAFILAGFEHGFL